MKKKLIAFLCAVLCLAPLSGCGPEGGEDGNLEFLTLAGARELSLAAGQSEELTLDVPVGDRNYFVLDAASDVPVLGRLICAAEDAPAGAEGFEEEFFLAAGTDGAFRQILDYYRAHTGAKRVSAIRFENVGTAAGTLRVREAKLARREVEGDLYDAPEVSLSSQAVRLGIDMKSGGAVHSLEYLRAPVQQVKNAAGEVLVGLRYAELPDVSVMYSEGVNLLNRFDRGRLVQQSYYGIQDPPYVSSQYMGSPWPYNPVQGGDWTGTSSQIVDYEITGDSVYVKCRALDWAKGGRDGSYSVTPSYMESRYTIDGETVKVENRFTDFSGYEHIQRDQELPAFYGIISLGTLVTYRGSRPFEDEALSYYADLGSWMDVSSRAKWNDLTENWMAWVNDDDFGVGLYTPDAREILTGRVGTRTQQQEGRIETSEATTYSTLLEQIRLTTYEPFRYAYYISVGSVRSMRRTFNKLAETETNPDIKEWNE